MIYCTEHSTLKRYNIYRQTSIITPRKSSAGLYFRKAKTVLQCVFTCYTYHWFIGISKTFLQ